ncbi:hypothetical protein X971_3497 [Agrobacterium tumefaciens LBA4213 (Ach5)]|nr:hypothetical protein X971_3497 [Agrobacterium tumefaciens LBA4213 (Ach5)]
MHRDYLHDAADTAGCRPARRREQNFPDRNISGIAACAARNGRLGISGKRKLKMPETEMTALILSCVRYVSTVRSGNRHDFSVMRNLSLGFPA